jgi:hypothetical protein
LQQCPFSESDLSIIRHNRLGFAVQLCYVILALMSHRSRHC